MKRWLPFEWIAAIRFLLEGRMQSLFIIAGVAIGVGVIIFMSSILSANQANFLRRTLTSQAHIVLTPPDEMPRSLRGDANGMELAVVQRPSQRLRSVDQWQSILDGLRRNPQISHASPMAAGSALALKGDASRSITMMGIDPEHYFHIVKLPENMVAGQVRLLSDDIMIGTELAKELGVGLGERIVVSSAGGRSATLKVSGIFDLGNKGANQRSTYVNLRTAQALLDLIGGVTSIDVTVPDPYRAEDVAEDLRKVMGVQIDSWIRTNAQFFTAINAQTIANTAIRGLVGLSVAFGIASVLVVSVVQRSREIGILRAMGTSRGQILRIFLLQGGLLGLLGSCAGSLLGLVALHYWHLKVRNPDGTEVFPLAIEPQLFFTVAVIATITGVLAAMTPARSAARLDPVVAIRG